MSVMKGAVSFLLLFFLFCNISAQNKNEAISALLGRISEKSPADQLFLHTDRNLYHSGDTLRFQAFIRDYQTGVFETESISLHVLLLNPEHITIDSARFRISYSTASGWLKVPDNAPPGDYSIVAFTSDQMNYDPQFACRMQVRIDRLKPERITVIQDSIISAENIDLRFLPEGGTYITGIKQRIAFNVVRSDGKSIKASGIITNLKGDKITEFRSGSFGPGIIEITPNAGESYFAKPSENEFGNLSWPLPSADPAGISLRVENPVKGLTDIIVRGRGVAGNEYFLTVTMSNIMIFSHEIILDTLFSIRIKTSEIPSGTAFVTLYDNELNQVAERLVFLNRDKKMNVQIGVSPGEARPGKETELTINTTDEEGENVSSIVSVSVIDSISGYYNGMPYPDIETVFLYDREFYYNLPMRIRCLGLKNIDTRSIDLLMLTFGWRKYTLKESEMTFQEKRPDNYDHLKIRNPGLGKRGRQEFNILSPESGDIITLGIDTNREAVLPYDSLGDFARQIMVLPDEDPARNMNPVTIEFPENKKYTDNAKLINNDISSFSPEFTATYNEMPVFNPDSSIMIEPVTIKGHRKKPALYGDKTAQNYKYAGAYTLYSKDFKYAQTFEDILYNLNAFRVDKKSKKVILRAKPALHRQDIKGYEESYGGVVALFVVDEVPIYDRSYWPIYQLPADQIASVTVVRGFEGFARYGTKAYGGVIFVTTKIGNRLNGIIDPNEESETGNEFLKYIRLFRSEVEYYIPTKEQVESVPEYQFRPTLLWKSDVYLDGSGPVKLSYPDNIGNGTAMIFVNGVSMTNLIGSERGSYSVK